MSKKTVHRPSAVLLAAVDWVEMGVHVDDRQGDVLDRGAPYEEVVGVREHVTPARSDR